MFERITILNHHYHQSQTPILYNIHIYIFACKQCRMSNLIINCDLNFFFLNFASLFLHNFVTNCSIIEQKRLSFVERDEKETKIGKVFKK
jgi:hypothetical protein